MQTALFHLSPHPRHRMTDPETAVNAAASITPGRTEQHILDAFAKLGYRKPRHQVGFTDDELVRWFAGTIYGPTLKTARRRLARDGRLRDSGLRRPSDRGRDQIVWVLNG